MACTAQPKWLGVVHSKCLKSALCVDPIVRLCLTVRCWNSPALAQLALEVINRTYQVVGRPGSDTHPNHAHA